MDKNEGKSRIGIDARFYGPLGKGLGRYVQEVVDNVIKLDSQSGKDFEYVIFLSPENYDDFICPNESVTKKLVKERWYSWREQVFFPFTISREKLDLIHYPHFNVPIFTPLPFVVTIHDLILTRFPSRRASLLPPILYWLKQIAYRLVVRIAVSRARAIITVSEFTKNDIIAKFGADPKKIRITYEGVVSLDRVNDPVDIAKRYGIREPYLLYVGNAYPHKNLERLLSVYKAVRKSRPEISLVMVGKEDYFYHRVHQEASRLGLTSGEGGGRVVFPGYVPDADLGCLYEKALVYVFPSLYEGFGLPPLEAMSKGCPVISSNQGSLPEVLGDAAVFFDPYDERAMEMSLLLLIDDEGLRRSLAEKGKSHISRFSWRDCAQKTADVYKEILKK